MTKNPCATRRAALRGLRMALCVAIPAIASNHAPEVMSVQPATIDDGAIALYGIIRELSDHPNTEGTVLAVQVTAADVRPTTALRQNAGGEPCPDCTTTHYFLVQKPDEVTPKILRRRVPGPVTYIHIKGKEYMLADIRLTWAGDGTPGLEHATLWQTGFAPPIFKRRVKIRFEAPEIFNTDQGSQFTSEAFTDVLKNHPIAISMDGKGRWVDNVFIERLWRSVKYEDVYLRAYETPTELRTGLARYFDFYNTRRRHSALDRRTPDAVYFDQANRNLAA